MCSSSKYIIYITSFSTKINSFDKLFVLDNFFYSENGPSIFKFDQNNSFIKKFGKKGANWQENTSGMEMAIDNSDNVYKFTLSKRNTRKDAVKIIKFLLIIPN